ncbi:MAG: hypothetical protein ACLP7P_08940 [Rhodomicrobium sp.]
MPNRSETRTLIAILLCLGPLPALAQDNPWRVPGYQADGWAAPGYGLQRNGGGWQSSQPQNSGMTGSFTQNGAAGGQWNGVNGAGSWRGPEAQMSQPRAWETGPDARTGSGAGSYASLNQPGLQPQTGSSNAPAASGWRQNYGEFGAGTQDSSRYNNPGYSVPSTMPPTYLYGRQYGEFPPLGGEQRVPSAEGRLPQPAPPPLPQVAPQQAYPQRASVPQAYGYGSGYGYGNGVYPDPALGGPSTLGNPWSGYGSYGSPYGTGVPGPYGW